MALDLTGPERTRLHFVVWVYRKRKQEDEMVARLFLLGEFSIADTAAKIRAEKRGNDRGPSRRARSMLLASIASKCLLIR